MRGQELGWYYKKILRSSHSLNTTRYLSNHSKYKEIDLSTDRTNSTNRSRGHIEWGVEWFWGEMKHECYAREEALVREKRERGEYTGKYSRRRLTQSH